MFKKLVKYFLQGLLYILPVGLTVYVVYYLVNYFDSILNLGFPGVGIIVMIVAITIIGYLGSTVLSSVFSYFGKLLEKLPLIKIIFSSIKDLTSAFVGQKKKFDKPVLVKISNDIEMERLGFITKEDLGELGIKEDKVAVYFPYSYSIMGKLVIVPKKNITSIEMSSASIMKFIVSGGVTTIGHDDEDEEQGN